jgi:SOS-response transcriptional repressor LexA
MNTREKNQNAELITSLVDNQGIEDMTQAELAEVAELAETNTLAFAMERLTKKTVQNRTSLRIQAPAELEASIRAALNL